MPSFVSRLLFSQTQPVLNAFAKEVQLGQEKCAAKCANCTRIWGKLELLPHCSTSHNHGGLEPLKAPQLQTKNPRRSEGLLWYYRDSNLGHTDFQSVALPTELWYHFGVRKHTQVFFQPLHSSTENLNPEASSWISPSGGDWRLYWSFGRFISALRRKRTGSKRKKCHAMFR